MKIHLIACAAATLLLAACGKAPEPPVATQPAPPAEQPAASPAAATEAAAAPSTPAPGPAVPSNDEPKELRVFCWSEYIPQSVIDQFTAETGIKVSVANYASNEEMLAKLLAGGGSFDIIQPSEYVIQGLIKEDALVPIDKSLIPNLKNIDPEFLGMQFDPENKFTVPFMAGTVGIVVNTELVQDEIKGFSDVFQPKHKGNIVVLDDAREIVSWGLLSMGIPINDVSDENLEKVKPLLQQWIPLVKVFDSDSPKTALLNGDVALGVVWGGEGAILYNTDKKFKWVVPAEGTHLFVDSLAIPEGAKHPKNAMAFMNFILRPDVSAAISAEFPYTNPNAEARKLLGAEALANPASFPTREELEKMQLFEDIGDQATKIDELVTTIKAQ